MSAPSAAAEVDVHIGGEGAETIVMVHGWPDTYRLWNAQVLALKGRYRCLRFTLPGFEAPSSRRAYPLGELIDVLKRLVEQHSPGRKVILMVHDWGCVLGYEFAMRYPQLVSRIVGVDIGDPRSLGRSMSRRDRFLVFAYQTWLALAWTVGGRLGDWMTRYMARRARCPSDEAFMGSRMNYLYYLVWFGSRESFRGQVQRFRPVCPMLFIYGRRKPFMFHAASWLDELRAQPANQVVEFETGHWVMSAQPERFNQVVANWLAQ